MNITFLLTQSLDYPSGGGRYYPLAKELARLGHQVKIIALHHDFLSLAARSFSRKGVEIQYVGQMHVRSIGDHKSYFSSGALLGITALSTWRMAIKTLSARTDLFHLGKPHPMNGIAGMVGKLLRRKPLYLDCDDCEALSNRFPAPWQKGVVALFEDMLPRWASGITVNTSFLREQYRAACFQNKPVVRVPNGVDRERFTNLDKRIGSELRTRLGLEEKRVVLYIGSLSLTNHPLRLLLEAFSLVSREFNEAVLLIVGSGEDRQAVDRWIEQQGMGEKVIMVGRVEPQEVPYYFMLGEVSVDPVNDDPVARSRSPLKIFESLVMGVPVVTGDVGDRREILQGERAGLVVRPGDSQALAEGVLAVLRDQDRARAMATAGLEMSERYFWDNLVKDFVRVYG